MFPKVTLVILSIFLVACHDKDEPTQQDCTMVACTQNFVTLTVSVKDASGAAIVLDSYEVINVDSGKNLTDDFNDEENQYFKEQGLYPILSDAHRVEYQNSTATLTFKGYISNEEVINEEFVVGADCCHVSLISGNTEIILD
ncbi:hypothetical protein [uncultured Maribacter sp.]|uniref:hypothetical protein n=1 Tax=uncultured Maribacter sp. TaxID=431308 RepID=UPI0030D8FF82|tara:strand:- start:57 stop:482 length:426 start_codon:yes stop_codon:yes gene_type:complete